MASANKLQRLLIEMDGRVRHAGRALTLAIQAGAFGFVESQSQSLTDFWSGRIDGQTPRAARIPGTPGGMVWRYLVAIASWEALLLRVNQLLGPQARDAVAKLTVPEDIDDTPDFDVAAKVVANALRTDGFSAFAMTRFADIAVVSDLSARTRSTVASSEWLTCRDAVDFISDLLVQENELADLARLPDVLASNAYRMPQTASLARHASGQDLAISPAQALQTLIDVIIERRIAIRNAVSEALQANPILDGLVSCRLTPYAESRFVIAGAQRPSRSPTDMPLWLLQRNYENRLRQVAGVGLELPQRDNTVLEMLRTSAAVLAGASVPFLYWCAKSGLDVRRLWGTAGDDEATLWPLPRSHGHGNQYVALVTRSDGRSFAGGMRFLMKARKENPYCNCLLITDNWNEERAAAIFQETADVQSVSPITVLRSDGPQYPASAFCFPHS